MEPNDELMHFAGEPTWNRGLPTNETASIIMLARSAGNAGSKRTKLEAFAYEQGINYDRKNWSQGY